MAVKLICVLSIVLGIHANLEALPPNVKTFRESTLQVLKRHEEERTSIMTTGEWHPVGTWASVTPLLTSAYEIACSGFKKIHEKPQFLYEFEEINRGLKAMVPFLRTANLTLIHVNNTVKLQFPAREMFENGTSENSPKSRRYLPIVGALFNANYNSSQLLAKFIDACKNYNVVQILKDHVYSMEIVDPLPENSTLIAQMANSNRFVPCLLYIDSSCPELKLELNASEDRLLIYAMGLMHAECFALSQKPYLVYDLPKSISGIMPHFTTILNLLQMKYKRSVQILQGMHSEL